MKKKIIIAFFAFEHPSFRVLIFVGFPLTVPRRFVLALKSVRKIRDCHEILRTTISKRNPAMTQSYDFFQLNILNLFPTFEINLPL